MMRMYFQTTDLKHSVDRTTSAKLSMAIESKKEQSSSLSQVLQHPRNVRHEYSLLAGVAGGVVSSSLLHPLDTIKTRLAASNGHRELMNMRPQYRGLIDAFKCILRTDGIGGLYRGLGLAVLSSGMTWGSYFFFYDTIKAELQEGDMTRPLGPTLHMAAASSAGLITLVLTNPIYVVKTRLCLQFGPNPQCLSEEKRYKGIMDALIKTCQHEGLRGLYRGFVPGIFGVSYSSLQFMTYQELKNGYNCYLGMSIDTPLSTMTYLSFATTSKLFACTVSYPYQLMRTRLQDQYQEYKGLIDVVSKTWRYEGLRGFYKGLLPQLLRVTPATAITFVVYEKVFHHLTEPVTPHQQHHQVAAIQQPTGGSTIVSSQSSNGSCSLLADGTLYKINGPAV